VTIHDGLRRYRTDWHCERWQHDRMVRQFLMALQILIARGEVHISRDEHGTTTYRFNSGLGMTIQDYLKEMT
jgi:hypothetical protein